MVPNVLDRGVDDVPCAVEVGDRVVVGYRGAAELFDLAADLRGGIVFGAAPVERHADVVDHDVRALTERSRARTRARYRDPTR